MSHRPTPCSRRQFVTQLAQGAVTLGSVPVAAFGATNPFAYDVSRFSKTDPALVRWAEVLPRRTAIKDARRLAIGPGDMVHVAAGSTIVRWNPSGAQASLNAGAPVTCLGLAADGTVLAGLRNQIVTFDAEGRSRPLWAAETPRSWISGIVASEDDVWIADSGLRVVWHCDRAGKLRGRIGEKQSERNIAGFVVPSPFLDVRLHPDGLLRINNPGRHRVDVFTRDGDFELSWGKPSAAIDGFCGCCNPIALAVLPDGRTVTCEKGLPRVKIYRGDGTFESVVAPTESFEENHHRSAEAGDSQRTGLDVAVDSLARIHILDRVTGEVRVMQPKAGA